MAGKVLSISLGSEIVKVCEVALAGKKKVQVYNAIDLIIPEGLCEDGVILDVEALAGAIKKGLAGEGFTSKRIVFTITSKRIANKEAIIPFCKENRIKDIVQINASEYFPITNLDNYTFNHSIIEVVQSDSIKNYRLSVTATPNDLIEQYYDLAKAMGMSVESIDYSGNSVLQLLKLQNAGEGVDAILQVGGENSIVNIMNGATMVMQRSVPYGRLSLVDAVAGARGITDEDADMALINEDVADLSAQYPDVADAVRSLLSSVGRILEFYRARNSEHPIERVFMIGDISSVNGLPELINSEMDYDVEVVETLRGVEIKNHKILSDEIVANYLANIGAVIDPMRIAISQDKKTGEKVAGERLPWWMLIFAAVVAIAMCGAILFIYFTKKNENDSIRSQIAALGDVETIQQQYESATGDLEKLKAWYDTTKGNNESMIKFIWKLEEIQPSVVSIQRMTSNNGEVTIEGSSYGKPAVAELIMQIKALPYISDVRTEYIDENFEDLSAKDKFIINFKLLYDDPLKDDSGEEVSETENGDSEPIEVSEPQETVEEPAEEQVDEPVGEPDENTEGGVE